MTVAQPIVDVWDGANRRVYLKQGVTDFYPIEDIYHEYRSARRTDESLRKFEALLKAEGNIAKGGGAFTPRYVVLLDGTKVVPYDEGIRINQLGDMITDDPDNDPDLYDLTGFVNPIRVFIKPSEAEIIQLNSGAIEYGSFNGGVTYDEDNGVSGTNFPIGTPQQPVGNVYDARSIAVARGFSSGYIIGDMTVPEYELDGMTPFEMFGFTFSGAGKDRTTIIIPDLANVYKCTYLDALVNGYLDGDNTLNGCLIEDLHYIKGYIEICVLSGEGIIELGGTDTAYFLGCRSGEGLPTIHMGGAGQPLVIEDHSGSIKLTSKSGPEHAEIGMKSGVLVIDMASVINGTISVSGIGRLTDQNGGHIHSGTYGNLVILNELNNKRENAEAVWEYERD